MNVEHRTFDAPVDQTVSGIPFDETLMDNESFVEEILGTDSLTQEEMTEMQRSMVFPSSLTHKTLVEHLPVICEMLSCDVADLKMLNYIHCAEYSEESKLKDHVIDVQGLYGIPEIRESEWCRNNSTGYGVANAGIVLYKTRGDKNGPPITYVTVHVPSPRDNLKVVICKKGDQFRLVRYAKNMQKLCSVEIKPILHDGMLQDVLNNTIEFLRAAKEFKLYDTKVKRGIVLSGEPGNGKTMTCRYIRTQAFKYNIPIMNINGSDILNLFQQGCLAERMNRDGIIFLDDIDVDFFSRKGSKNDIAGEFLSALDGMENRGNTIRIFTTNEKISDMDPAFKRPGRIDKIFRFDKPSREMRQELFEIWPQEMQDSIDVEEFLNNSEDFSFAECDAIKSILVTNKIIDKIDWDLEKAFEDYHVRAGNEFVANRVGFATVR